MPLTNVGRNLIAQGLFRPSVHFTGTVSFDTSSHISATGIDDYFSAGDWVAVTGTASNNGLYYITSTAADQLTVDPAKGDDTTTESSVANTTVRVASFGASTDPDAAFVGVGDSSTTFAATHIDLQSSLTANQITGTVSISGTALTGSGTDFDPEINVGDLLYLATDDVVVEIATRTDDTNATVVAGFGASGSGQNAYVVKRYRQGMESGYPTRTTNVLTYRALFGVNNGNFTWNEWGIFNHSYPDDKGVMLNRKVENLGTKTSAQSWQITITLTVNAA